MDRTLTFMNGALEGKVALVTGAGQGLGRSIAVAMTQAGARVAGDAGHSATTAPRRCRPPRRSLQSQRIPAGQASSRVTYGRAC